MGAAILNLMQEKFVAAGGEAASSHGMLVVVVSPAELLAPRSA